jgi:hypothetical protein
VLCKRALLLTAPLWILTAFAQDRNPVVLLWPSGAPGSEGKTGDEKIRTQQDDQIVSSIHHPSLTVYLPPKNKSSGAAEWNVDPGRVGVLGFSAGAELAGLWPPCTTTILWHTPSMTWTV